MSGTRESITVCHGYRDVSDPRNLGGPHGLPGLYSVVFTFSRPGYSELPEYKLSFERGLEGDSHLAIVPPAFSRPDLTSDTQVKIDCTTAEGLFVCFGIPNKKGFLGKVRFEPFQAESFTDAHAKAMRALAAGLSHMTLFLDIPLHIQQVDIRELRTENQELSYIIWPREAPLVAMPVLPLPVDFRNYASLYREALNSNSAPYQLLCYFKIIEGLRARRNRRAVEARKRGEVPPSLPRIKLPKNRSEQLAWLKSLFPVGYEWDDLTIGSVFIPGVAGRNAEDVVRNELRGLRLKIAHAVLDSGEPGVELDQGLDAREIEKWLPLARCLCRAYLRAQFPEMFGVAGP